MNEACNLMVLQKELDVDESLRKDAKPAMVCTANDLQEWKEFPKGLKVLLLEGDNTSVSEIRAKLEAMDYNGKILFGFFLFVSVSHFFMYINFGLPICTLVTLGVKLILIFL